MYFITCFSQYQLTESSIPNIGYSRTFGYYNDRSTAIEMVEINNLDIQERLYEYAVIECIPEGLYNPAEERIFFKWNEDKQVFERIEGFVDCWGNYAFG
jgi:hypothetical protein